MDVVGDAPSRAPGQEGEAVERVRAWLAGPDDKYLHAMRRRRADVRALLAERERLIDQAVTAAFAPEEGAEVQWGIQYPEDSTVSSIAADDAERLLASDKAPHVRRRVVGPWRSAATREDGTDG